MSFLDFNPNTHPDVIQFPIPLLKEKLRSRRKVRAVHKKWKRRDPFDNDPQFATYKQALQVMYDHRFSTAISPDEEKSFYWAKEIIEKERAKVAKGNRVVTEDKRFVNLVEEFTIKILHLRALRDKNKAVHLKHNQWQPNSSEVQSEKDDDEDVESSDSDTEEEPATSNSNNRKDISQTRKKLTSAQKKKLCVGLVDRSHPTGQISPEQWKIVETKLLKEIAIENKNTSSTNQERRPALSFDGRGWHTGMKLIRCDNTDTLNFLRSAVPHLTNLWPGGRLEIVKKKEIESLPTGKVHITQAIEPEAALKQLQCQNPKLPSADWSIIKVTPNIFMGGYDMVLQINRRTEDLIYPKNGTLSWGTGKIMMRLKKRIVQDKKKFNHKKNQSKKN